MYANSRAGATLSEPAGAAAARGELLLFSPNHDQEQADSSNGSAITLQPLSTVFFRGAAVRAASGARCASCDRCEACGADSGAAREQAAVEIRGVAL